MDFQVSMVMEAGQSPLKRLLGLLHRELFVVNITITAITEAIF